MHLKTLEQCDLKKKTVIFRTAYDVPLEEKDGTLVVGDDSRIRASLPTLRYLLKQQCKVIILTWLGRPGGEVVENLKLNPVATSLSQLIKKPVQKLDTWDFDEIRKTLAAQKSRDIFMLENVRFAKGEHDKNPSFAKQLATLADVVVFEAFEQSHRDVPSTTGLLERLPGCVGLHMTQELETLKKIIDKPKAPFIVLLGGAKISDKLDTLVNLLQHADAILIGGAMAHNFLKAHGIKVGSSYVESAVIESKKEKKHLFQLAEEIENKTKDIYVNLGAGLNIPKLVLPLDLVAASHMGSDAQKTIIPLSEHKNLPWNWTFLDIGPETIAFYASIIAKAKTVFWNGPMGYYECAPFSKGTKDIANAIIKSGCFSLLGGGDTEHFVKKFKLEKKFNHVSTGGGALLHYVSGKELPVLKYLTK